MRRVKSSALLFCPLFVIIITLCYNIDINVIFCYILTMKIALVGYGRMGKMVHSLINETGEHEVALIVDPLGNVGKLESSMLAGIDVAVDFSSSEAVPENIRCYAAAGCPAVIGTTGWDHSLLDGAKGAVRIIHSGNFSIGVLVFLRIVSEASKLIDAFDQYDAAVVEAHHSAKADHPSGTALMIASNIIGNLGRKKQIGIGCPDGRIADDVLEISSVRVGSVPGTHSVIFDSDADTIELKHTARSRSGFAAGAIKAAEWITGQENGIYTMDDFMADILGGR